MNTLPKQNDRTPQQFYFLEVPSITKPMMQIIENIIFSF